MSVHYKFKNAAQTWDTVTFNSAVISALELKRAIVSQKKVPAFEFLGLLGCRYQFNGGSIFSAATVLIHCGALIHFLATVAVCV